MSLLNNIWIYNKYNSWVEYRLHLLPLLPGARTDIRGVFLHKRNRRVVNREVPIPQILPNSEFPLIL
jgi:hypothetical protein